MHWVNPLAPPIVAIRAPLLSARCRAWGDASTSSSRRRRARARRARLQARRRSDRGRALSTAGRRRSTARRLRRRVGGQPGDVASSARARREHRRAERAARRTADARPPPGAYGASAGSARRSRPPLRLDRAADDRVALCVRARARARPSRRRGSAPRREARARPLASRGATSTSTSSVGCRARRTRSGARRRGRTASRYGPGGIGAAHARRRLRARLARRDGRSSARADAVPDDRVAALVEPVVGEEEPVLAPRAARSPRRRSRARAVARCSGAGLAGAASSVRQRATEWAGRSRMPG